MKISGIYKIQNVIDGKSYIGQSIDVKHREWSHFSWLLNNKHPNIHLQRAYNKYGKENFIFNVLLICEKTNLTYYEQKISDTYKNLYNIRSECINSNKGMKHSTDTKIKMSLSQSGRKHTEETKLKISKSHMGKKISDHQKNKLLESHLGKPISDEIKLKISKSLTGRKMSESSIRKTASAHTGMKRSEETKQKMRVAWEIRKVQQVTL